MPATQEARPQEVMCGSKSQAKSKVVWTPMPWQVWPLFIGVTT